MDLMLAQFNWVTVRIAITARWIYAICVVVVGGGGGVLDIKVLLIPGAVTVSLCFTAPTCSINTRRPLPTGLMMTSRSKLRLRMMMRSQSTGTNWRGFCEQKIFSENKYSIYWVSAFVTTNKFFFNKKTESQDGN